MLSCIALIGQKNNPLYIRTAEPDRNLKLQHAVYSSLDVIDEKVANTTPKASASDRDMFLGLLFPADEHRLYGYVTSTNIKLVLVVSDPAAVDRDIKKLFRSIHESYIALVSNPFYNPDSVIESKKFDSSMDALLVDTSKS
eukprot:m.104222 g.104222  ORF g.104222 m.104222 type:complete len:141 (-) comp12605_c0_seq1:2396-2818(-)